MCDVSLGDRPGDDGLFDESAEDKLMRAGAAFILSKPIDVDALLTQAAFLVG